MAEVAPRPPAIPPQDIVRVGRTIIIENQVWHTIRTRQHPMLGEIIYVKCGERRRGCQTTGKIVNGVLSLSRLHPRHSHSIQVVDVNGVRTFRAALFQAAGRQLGKSLNKIYLDIAQNYAPEIVHAVPYADISARIYQIYRNARPPVPETFLELQRMVQDGGWIDVLLHDHGHVQMTSLTAADGHSAVIWGDATFAPTIPNLHTLSIQLNAAVNPAINGTQSVLSVTAVYQKRALTFGWALLNQVTQPIIHDIITFVHREFFLNDNPSLILTNLDYRLLNCIRENWPEAEVKTTFPEACMAILRYAEDHQAILPGDMNHLCILRKMMMITTIPSDMKRLMFWSLKNALNAMNYGQEFEEMLNWYYQVFISPENESFSAFFDRIDLFQDVSTRISQQMYDQVHQQREPNFWFFYRKTLKILTGAYHDLHILRTHDQNAIRNLSMTPKIRPCLRSRLLRYLFLLCDRNALPLTRMVYIGTNGSIQFPANILYQEHYKRGQALEQLEPGVVIEAAELNNPFRDPIPDLDLFLELDVDQDRLLHRQGRRDIVAVEEANPANNMAEHRAVGPPNQQDEDRGGDQGVQQYDDICMICHEQPIAVITRPCNCICICDRCEEILRVNARHNDDRAEILQCPNCEERALTFEHVFIPCSQDAGQHFDWVCQVCADQTISWMGQLCRHVFFCGRCVLHLQAHSNYPGELLECPYCKQVETMVKVILRNRPG